MTEISSRYLIMAAGWLLMRPCAAFAKAMAKEKLYSSAVRASPVRPPAAFEGAVD